MINVASVTLRFQGTTNAVPTMPLRGPPLTSIVLADLLWDACHTYKGLPIADFSRTQVIASRYCTARVTLTRTSIERSARGAIEVYAGDGIDDGPVIRSFVTACMRESPGQMGCASTKYRLALDNRFHENSLVVRTKEVMHGRRANALFSPFFYQEQNA